LNCFVFHLRINEFYNLKTMLFLSIPANPTLQACIHH
jgi:hypothetical protein